MMVPTVMVPTPTPRGQATRVTSPAYIAARFL
jgi:hypothetical protein